MTRRLPVQQPSEAEEPGYIGAGVEEAGVQPRNGGARPGTLVFPMPETNAFVLVAPPTLLKKPETTPLLGPVAVLKKPETPLPVLPKPELIKPLSVVIPTPVFALPEFQ